MTLIWVFGVGIDPKIIAYRRLSEKIWVLLDLGLVTLLCRHLTRTWYM
jgi:hypothetical protein